MQKKISHNKKIKITCLIICIFLLGAAAYLQVYYALKPCPLCIIQKIVILSLGIFFLWASLINLSLLNHRIFYSITSVLSILGLSTAARQVWLEHLTPGHTTNCLPSLNYMFDNFPFFEALNLIFTGTGSDCSHLQWSFLGWSIAQWMLLPFIFFLTLSLWQLSLNKETYLDRN